MNKFISLATSAVLLFGAPLVSAGQYIPTMVSNIFSPAIEKVVEDDVDKAFNMTVSPETMLQLSAEVYAKNPVRELCWYGMDVKSGDVDGWHFVDGYPSAEDRSDAKNGVTMAFWVNEVDPHTYCLSICGTDQLGDMLEYIPMEAKEERTDQLDEVYNYVKTFLYIIADKMSYKTPDEEQEKYGYMRRLYITGHSLGGYLAMSLMTDLIDAEVAKKDGVETNSPIRFQDIYSTALNSSNTFCYTFSAPGLMTEFPQGMVGGGLKWLNKIKEIPQWSLEKQNNNKKGLYKNNVFQYTNTRDLVPNLNNVLGDKWDVFLHVGTEYECVSRKLTIPQTMAFLRRFSCLDDGIMTTGMNALSVLTGINYHLPSTYLAELELETFEKISL